MLIPLPYKILAIVFVVGGAFTAGYRKGTEQGEVMIQQAANEADHLRNELEKEQHNIKEHVVTEYKDRIIHVKDKEVVYQNAIQQALPSKFNVSNGWVYIHDSSVNGGALDAQKAGDSTDSPYTENQALSSVLGNYSVCLQNAQQLVSLQSWILKTKESVDKQNAERGLGVKLPDMPWSKK